MRVLGFKSRCDHWLGHLSAVVPNSTTPHFVNKSTGFLLQVRFLKTRLHFQLSTINTSSRKYIFKCITSAFQMWQIDQSLKMKLVWAALMWGDDKKMPAHEKRVKVVWRQVKQENSSLPVVLHGSKNLSCLRYFWRLKLTKLDYILPVCVNWKTNAHKLTSLSLVVQSLQFEKKYSGEKRSLFSLQEYLKLPKMAILDWRCCFTKNGTEFV